MSKKMPQITVFPLGVIPKESVNGWIAEEPILAYIQLIDSGFAIYKFAVQGDAGYEVYETIEDLLKDFDVADEDDMHRIDALRA